MHNYRQLGFGLAEQYYAEKDGWQWIQYEDLTPHPSLKGQQWADDCHERWVGEFFYNETDTGLVPISGLGKPQPNGYYAVQDFGRISPLKAVENIAAIALWHGDQLERVKEYASIVYARHRFGNVGWYYGVDAHTGVPAADTHNVTSYGGFMRGLRMLGLTEESKAVHDVVAEMPIIPERWTAYGPIHGDYSSDGCYWIRSLPDNEERQMWAKQYSDEYWSDYGHPTNHRGSPNWYSDGMVNQLVMHVYGDRLDLFDAAWRLLQRESINGFPPEMVTAGKGNGKPHKNQELFLEALVERAEHTSVASDIAEARRFADLLLDNQVEVRNDIFSRALIRLSEL